MGFFARLQNISPKPEVFVYVIPGFGILSICALIVQIITTEQFWKCPALFSLTMSLRFHKHSDTVALQFFFRKFYTLPL